MIRNDLQLEIIPVIRRYYSEKIFTVVQCEVSLMRAHFRFFFFFKVFNVYILPENVSELLSIIGAHANVRRVSKDKMMKEE